MLSYKVKTIKRERNINDSLVQAISKNNIIFEGTRRDFRAFILRLKAEAEAEELLLNQAEEKRQGL